MLDQFVELTEYNRNYAGWLLRNYGRKRVVKLSGEWVEIVVGGGRRRPVERHREYGEEVKRSLIVIWEHFDFMRGQRLAPMMREMLSHLFGYGEMHVRDEVKAKLMKLSPATIDRLLREEKRRMRIRP